MKKLAMAATILAVLGSVPTCMISCSDDKPGDLSLVAPTTSYQINQGDTLKIPVSLDNANKGNITATVASSDAKYPASISTIEQGAATIKVAAPEIITSASAFTVTLDITDSQYSRKLEQVYNVTPVIASNFVTVTDRANCHIVAPGSIVMFPASIGDSTANVAFDAVDLIWQDHKDLVKKVISQDSNIIVVLGSGVSGNAMIGASKSGKNVWDWMLWVCDYNPEKNVMTYTTSVATDGSTYKIMDRNLGGLSSDAGTDAFGLFFEWGRKEPFTSGTAYKIDNSEISFPVVAATDAATAAGTKDIYTLGNENPTTYYKGAGNGSGNYGWFLTDKTLIAGYTNTWGGLGAKTVYDPCPAGWRIPKTYAAFNFFADAASNTNVKIEYAYDANGTANLNKMGRLVSVDGGTTKFFFPFQGEYSNAGAFQSAYNGTNTWPCGKTWLGELDAANYRARAIQPSPTSVFLTGGVVTSYGCAIRCVKE